MARPKRPLRPRTVLRRQRIVDERLIRDRTKLLDLEAGGTTARPLEVLTPAVIEPKARSVRCPRCDEPFELVGHEAHSDEHGRLREAKLECRYCGLRRSLWFRVSAPS